MELVNYFMVIKSVILIFLTIKKVRKPIIFLIYFVSLIFSATYFVAVQNMLPFQELLKLEVISITIVVLFMLDYASKACLA